MKSISFSQIENSHISNLQKRYPLMRIGELTTPHGVIHTPAYVTVGTKATVKGLTPEIVKSIGAEVVLANTYHLYLQPGEKLIKSQGGFGAFMGWHGPTMTDSGGFQAFSLGAALGKNISKLVKENKDGKNQFGEILMPEETESTKAQKASQSSQTGHGSHGSRNQDIPEEAMVPAKIDAGGVMFRSIIDGSAHYFTPEKSIQIQHDLGADIIVAFDECTSPHEPRHYQQEAMDRTHRWAKTCLKYHHDSEATIIGSDGQEYKQALYAVVQGGRDEELRKESATILSTMNYEHMNFVSGEKPKVQNYGFDGYCIGGSFAKEDMSTAVTWVNQILPKDKPRHLLGIGEPEDIFMAIEQGCDTFDCVLPTRNGRTGTLFTSYGKINIMNAKYRDDTSKIDEYFICPMLTSYSRAYLSHLFHAKEMMGPILASVHNLYFLIELTKRIRQAILEGRYEEFKKEFLERYKKD